MQTIQLELDDTLYDDIVKKGIDIQKELKLALKKLSSKKNPYMHSQQYKDDKKYFNKALDSIDSGGEELVSHSDIWEQIEEHTKAN